MSGLAAFLDSSYADVYARVCQTWGVDPAEDLTDDDVMAFNIRAVLATKLSEPEEPEEASGTGVTTDLADQMRALGG